MDKSAMKETGQRKTFSELVKLYTKRFQTFVPATAGKLMDAEELMQEALDKGRPVPGWDSLDERMMQIMYGDMPEASPSRSDYSSEEDYQEALAWHRRKAARR